MSFVARTLIVFGCATLLLVVSLFLSQSPNIRLSLQSTSSQQSSAHVGWEHNGISHASQGKIWKVAHRRLYPGPMRQPNTSSYTHRFPSINCKQWAVVTTIFTPTKIIRQLSNLDKWCLVVVADLKTDHLAWAQYINSTFRTYYLSPTDQTSLKYRILDHLQWNNFGRKNIGYLFAIQHGAELIWDTDDDNQLINTALLDALLRKFSASWIPYNISASHRHVWNPYPVFNPVGIASARREYTCWPRGFPLEYVKDDLAAVAEPLQSATGLGKRIGVLQSLANNDPDVDGIYRLTKEVPFSFASSNKFYALRSNQYSPFNAQATLWTKQAFWAMLLPTTVHGRVSDIWRSYIAEHLMKSTDLLVAFTSPIVTQERNAHTLIADVQAEQPLYTQANELTKWLMQRDASPDVSESSLAMQMEKLAIELYNIGLVEQDDVKLYQAWLDDLHSIGYEMPDTKPALRETSLELAEKKAVDPSPARKPRVAVCVSGQVRTLTMPLHHRDHPKVLSCYKGRTVAANMVVAESIQKVLYPKLHGPDVFMYISTRETESEPKVGDLSVCEPLRPRNGKLFCRVPREEPIMKLDLPIWRKFCFPNDFVAHQGLLQQLRGMFECNRMIREQTRRQGYKYDWIVRVRPDSHFFSVPSLDTLLTAAPRPTIFYTTLKFCCCGNEDIFGIGPADEMDKYFDRFLYLQQMNLTSLRNLTRWNAETFLRLYMHDLGIGFEDHQELKMAVVKPLSRTHRSDP